MNTTTSVDERIVQMKFDNTNFEKNVQTTMTTLDKLKQALKFDNAKESLETISVAAKNVSFDALVKAAENTNSYFTVLGRTIDNIRDKIAGELAGAVTKIFTAIPNQIKTGGWTRAMNVEQAKFQLEGLGIAWKDVADDIDHAVLGTAYGSDAAAKAASQLAASGVKYGGVIGQITTSTGELKDQWSDMGRSLRAISGVAAMTNSSYEEIAHIFTTVAGQGKLMTMQLNQLAGRGLNVAAKLGEALGVSETEVREMVTKGVIDFQTFANAMDDAFGEHATAADKTLSGSMSNMKASLSRIGQDFAQTIQQQTPQVFTSIKNFFNKVRTYTRPIADRIFTPLFTNSMTKIATVINNITNKIPAFSEGGKVAFKYEKYFAAIRYGLTGIGEALYNLLALAMPIRDAFRETFGEAISVEKVRQIAIAFHEWGKNAIITDETAEAIKNVLKLILNLAKIVATIGAKMVVTFAPLTKVLVALAGLVAKIAGAFAELILQITGIESGGNGLSEFFSSLGNAINFVADLLVYLIGLLGDLAESFIITKGMAFLNFIVNIGRAIYDFASSIQLGRKLLIGFITILSIPVVLVASLAAGIAYLVIQISKLEIVQNIISGIVTAFNFARDAVIYFINNIQSAALAVSNFITNFKMSDVLDSVRTKIDSVTKSFVTFFEKLGISRESLEQVKAAFMDFIDKFNIFKEQTTSSVITEIGSSVQETIPKFRNLSDVLSFVGEKLKWLWDQLDIGKVAIIAYAFTVISLMRSIRIAVDGFTNVTSSITNVSKAVSGFINSWKKKEQSKLIETAEAILMFAAALAILSSCDQQALKSATIILAQFLVVAMAFLGFMTLMTKYIGSVGKDGKPTKIMGFTAIIAAFVSLAGTFLLLSVALKILQGMNFDENLIKNVGLIIGVVTVLMVLATLFNRFSGKGGLGLKGAVFMLSFSVVILAVGKALQSVAEVDFSSIRDNIQEIVIMMGMLGLLAFAASKIGVFNALGLMALVMVLKNITPELVDVFGRNMVSVFDGMLKAIRKNIDVIEILAVLISAITIVSGLFGNGINKFGTGVVKLSASFVILAYGIKMLSALDISDVNNGIAIVGRVFALYALLALALTIGGGGGNAHKVAGAIGGMVLSLYAISGAIYILGKMDPVAVMRGLKAVNTIMLCFAAIAFAASFAGNGKASFGSVLALVSGLIILFGEMMLLTLLDTDKLQSTAIAMGSVMLGLATLIRSIPRGNSASVAKGTIPTLITLIGLVASVGLALYLAGQQGFAAAAGAALSIKMVLKAAFGLFKDANDYASNNSIDIKKITKVILTMTSSLILIGGSLALSAGIAASLGANFTHIIAMAIAIKMIIKSMTPLIKMLSEITGFTKPKAKNVVITFSSILLVAAALSGLAAVAGYFGTSSLQIIVMALAMVMIVGALKKLILSMQMVPNFAKAKATALVIASTSLIPVVIALGGLAAAMSLTGTSMGTLIVSTITLMLVISSFKSLLATISALPTFNVRKAVALVIASSSIAIIGGSLALLALFPWENILMSSISIMLVMLSLSALIAVISTMTNVATVPNILIGLVTMAGTLMLVGGALIALAAIDKDGKMVQEAEMLSKVLFALAGVTAVLGLLGVAAGAGALAALAGISALVYGIMDMMEEVAARFREMEANQYTDILNGIDKLNGIGAKIAEGIGDFIGSLGEAIGSHLPAIGKGLSDFSDSLMPFVKNIKEVDGDALMGAVYTAGILAVLAGGELIQGIVEAFTGKSLGDVGDGLKNFGEGIVAFAKVTSEIDGATFKDTADAALTVAKMLGQLATGDLVSAITGMFTGWKDYNTTINQLGAFGEGISTFAENTKDISKSSVEGAVAAGECIAGLLHALPNQGGLLSWIVGDNKIGFFTKERMSEFASSIREFAYQVNGLDPGMADAGIELAGKIFSITPPNNGGLLGVIVGNNNYEFFTKEIMGNFGAAIREFAFQVNGVDVGMADGAIDVASKLFSLKIPNQGGALDVFTGRNDLETVAPGLSAMGRGIKGFATSVSDLQADTIVGVQTAIQIVDSIYSSSIIIQMNEILDYIGKHQKKWNNENTGNGLKKGFDTIGEAFGNLSSSFQNISISAIENALNAVKAMVDILGAIENFDSLSVKNFATAMKNCGDFGVSNFLEEFQNGTGDVTSAVSSFFNAISEAMHQEIFIITDACSSTIVYISNEFYNYDELFIEAGRHITNTFQGGIEKGTPLLFAYMKQLGIDAADELIRSVKSKEKEVEAAGEGLIASGSLLEGMEEGWPGVKKWLEENLPANMSTSIATIGDVLGGKFKSVGSLLGLDFSQGLQSGLSSVGSLIKNVLSGKVTMSTFLEKGFTSSEAAAKLSQTKQFVKDLGKEMGLVDANGKVLGGTLDNLTNGFEDVGNAAGGSGGAAEKVKDFGNSIYEALNSTSGMSFFNKLELKAETSADAILENMRSNVNGMVQWSTRLAGLMERGLNKEMIQTMAEAGMDSYDQINAFMNMTDEQIMEANNLFLQAEQVRVTAASELGAGWTKIGGGTMEGFANGVRNKLGLATGEIKEAMDSTVEEGKEALGEHSPSKVFEEMGDNAIIGFRIGILNTASTKLYPECIKIAELVIKTFEDHLGDSKDGSKSFMVGVNFSVGLARGIKAGAKEVEAAAEEVAEIPEKKSKSTMKEKSPSRVAMEIGRFFDLGLVEGIRNNQNEVESASNDLATSALDPLRSAMNNADSYIGRNINLNPVIRPTLDISGISTEASNLSELFNRQQAIRVDAMNNSWSNPDIRSEFLDTFANRIGSEYADRVVDAITNKDMNANVQLEGDAAGVFKLVRQQNRAFIRRTGYSGI